MGAATRSSSAGRTGTRSGAGSSPMTLKTPKRSKDARQPTCCLILGYTGRTEMIHRDDLVLGGE